MMPDSSTMKLIADNISEQMGLYYPENRHDELYKGLLKTSLALKGDYSFCDITNILKRSNNIPPVIFRELSIALTINETYFFREKTTIDFFESTIIPEIIQSKDRYLIWSAACSSGEEPYTIAILLKQHLPADSLSKVKIVATDISNRALEKAKKGKYTKWSFRETPEYIRDKYFKYYNNTWQISDEIRKMVSFSTLNLAGDSYTTSINTGYNLIFCRNVLIYFSNNIIQKISNKLYDSILENGWLVTSQVELNDQVFGKFCKHNICGSFFYNKSHKENRETVIKTQFPLHKPYSINNESSGVIPVKLKQQINTYRANKKSIQENAKADIHETTQQLFRKANDLANNKEYTKSLEILDSLLVDNPLKSEFFYLYGTILMELNENERASEYFKKCLYLNPVHILASYMLGVIYKDSGNHVISGKYLKKAYNQVLLLSPETIVEESGGITAGRLAEELKKNIDKKN